MRKKIWKFLSLSVAVELVINSLFMPHVTVQAAGEENNNVDIAPRVLVHVNGFQFAYQRQGADIVFEWNDLITQYGQPSGGFGGIPLGVINQGWVGLASDNYKIDFANTEESAINDAFCRDNSKWKVFENKFTFTTGGGSSAGLLRLEPGVALLDENGKDTLNRGGGAANYRGGRLRRTSAGAANRINQDTLFRLVGYDSKGNEVPLSCGTKALKSASTTTSGNVRINFDVTDIDSSKPIQDVAISFVADGKEITLGKSDAQGRFTRLFDPADQQNQLGHVIFFKKIGYKNLQTEQGKPVFFHQGGTVTAQIASNSSSQTGTVTVSQVDPNNVGGIGSPTGSGNKNDTAECGEYIGFGLTTGFRFQPGKYVLCQANNLVSYLGQLIGRLIKNVPV